MRVPINDLKRHIQSISSELQTALESVLSRGWYILGPEVEAFEAEYASYCGARHCIGVGNGTDALELALRALGVQPGMEVATVANAGMYSTTAILRSGARPLYVDVDTVSMNMDPNALESALGNGTAAIIVTHLYGRMAPMADLLAVASRRGVPVIEDCAQAHGAEIDGRKAGIWGTIGCFSFYPTKNLGALGDAGALVTSDTSLAARARLLRQYGWISRYRSTIAGARNSRLDEIQAAVLRTKLPHLDTWNERRRTISSAYSEAFHCAGITIPPACPGRDYVAHLYVARTADRDRLKATLTARGVGTDVHYPIPDHLQESMRSVAIRSTPLLVTELCCRQVLTLPCFPELSDQEVHQVVDVMRESLDLIPL